MGCSSSTSVASGDGKKLAGKGFDDKEKDKDKKDKERKYGQEQAEEPLDYYDGKSQSCASEACIN